MWVVKAVLKIHTDLGIRKYTGHAQEIVGEGYINKTSALENCETSAVGRACAMAGIGIVDSFASVDEIDKAKSRDKYEEDTRPWMSEKNLQDTIRRFVNDGELDIIEKAERHFRMKRAYRQQLDALKHGNHPSQIDENDPDLFNKTLED